MAKQKIRVIALGLIEDNDRILVSQGYDQEKQITFYRALGGGVDFGEHSRDALRREFLEELNAEITDIEYLDCLESIFVYNGSQGHEIIQLYRCKFVDRQFYQQEQIPFKEGDRQKLALWVRVERFKSGEAQLVPEGFIKFLG
ncbi:MAG: NUDIX domain-containing protein [Arthrospira sp. PLM2.Bin9]|nr:NUDIX hydrolase [Arthrospira sp. PLM2.Bin9]TVU52191.1 MAG: NUDIX domain-containing protein [Arthrospira sp. PLM2.Bin9]